MLWYSGILLEGKYRNSLVLIIFFVVLLTSVDATNLRRDCVYAYIYILRNYKRKAPF